MYVSAALFAIGVVIDIALLIKVCALFTVINHEYSFDCHQSWGAEAGKNGGFELRSSFQFKCPTPGKLTMVKRLQIRRPRDISVVQKDAHSVKREIKHQKL